MNKRMVYLMVNPKMRITHLEVALYYSRGVLSRETHRKETRGYYLVVQPVRRVFHRGEYITTYGYGRGIKKLLLASEHQSHQGFAITQHRANEQQREIVAQVLQKHGLELAA